MNKKLLTLFAFMIMVLFAISGCNSKTSEQGTSAADAEGKIRVAYIARAQADSFAAWLANSIKEEAAKYPNIVVDVFDGQANDDVENSLIENAIINKYDVIIIQPNNGEAQRPYAEKVVAAGIICITTNARIAGIEGASSVDADPYKQAAVNAVAALEQIPQGANVVVLNGPPGNFHADERRRSWQVEFFDKRPDVKIVGEQIANWNKDEALSLKQNLINNSIIRGSKISNIAANYRDWYAEYKLKSQSYQQRLKEQQEQKRLQAQREENAQVDNAAPAPSENRVSRIHDSNIFVPTDDLILEMDDKGEIRSLSQQFEKRSDGQEKVIVPVKAEPSATEQAPVVVPVVEPAATEQAPAVAPTAEPSVTEQAPAVDPAVEPAVTEQVPDVIPVVEPAAIEKAPAVVSVAAPAATEPAPAVVETSSEPEIPQLLP